MTKTALVVEDNNLNLRLFVEILKLEGMTVLTAEDGIAALEVLERCAPDIIVLDLQLPRLSGLGVARMIRAQRAFELTPIIAVSAFAKVSDRSAALKAGCDHYISKPVAPQELVDSVQRHIEMQVAQA